MVFFKTTAKLYQMLFNLNFYFYLLFNLNFAQKSEFSMELDALKFENCLAPSAATMVLPRIVTISFARTDIQN